MQLTHGNVLMPRQIGLDFGHQQQINLVLGGCLGGKGGGQHLNLLVLLLNDLVSTLHLKSE